ncbi:MAG TPA: WD40 repeat domain-containing protein [Anaerolineales bacterium]|nr:WD40 repeat domain-containing protein [Anaerolineales bacterium]
MLSRLMTGLTCFFVIFCLSCASQVQRLPVATPQFTPRAVTATPTGIAPSATVTLSPMPIPPDVIGPSNLKRVKLLHQYWLAVATAAGVDPYEMNISAIAASPDGRLLAIGGCSEQVEEDLRSGNVYCHGGDAQSAGGVPFLLILDADPENVTAVIPENKADTTIADLTFTTDGKKLIYAVHPGKFAVWDVASSKIESILWEGETSAPRIAISPDDKWIALKATDKVEIWDTAQAKLVAELPSFFRPQFSTDGGRIAVYSNGEFVVYETGTWTELLRFGMTCDCVYALSPNFSLLATSEGATATGESAPVVIWDISTGVQIKSLQAGKGFTVFLLFTPDGQMLWRAGDRGSVTAWDTSEWNLLAENIGGITPIFDLRGFQFVGNQRGYLLSSDLLLALYGLP